MNVIATASGCAADGMPFDAAVTRVLNLVPRTLSIEDVPLSGCAGRVVAKSLSARVDLPGFDQSAMDGYAVRHAGIAPGAWVPMSGRTAAGDAPGHLDPGRAHRILTGAPLPYGADTVVAQESVHCGDGFLRIPVVPPEGANVRRRGDDIGVGQTLIAEGTSLDWRHIAMMAAQGMPSVPVRRRPRVTLLSSGRELRKSGESLAPGQIHDSNLPMLAALLHAGGAIVRSVSLVPDDPGAMRSALQRAALNADLVVTTAGISVGDEDHVREALRHLGGDLAVLKVAMKPGKPLAAGRLGDAVFIGLPGNPQAALAGAIAFVRPLLARMAGTESPAPLRTLAGFDMRHKPGRAEFIPVRIYERDACLWAERAGLDGSGRLAPLLAATGLAFIPAHDGDVERGNTVDVISFMPGTIDSLPAMCTN